MSTPLFVRTPTVGKGTIAVLGASLAAFSGATVMADLTDVAAEATLIEEVAWCAQAFSTQAGMLILALVDGSGNRRLVGAYSIAAGSASLFANGRVQLGLTIAPGYKLVAAHNVQDSLSAYANLDLVPLGGVVR
jgi:hypothetical protein